MASPGCGTVVIIPTRTVGWSTADWGTAAAHIAQLGCRRVMLTWTEALGHALYDSRNTGLLPGLKCANPVATLLDAAEQNELDVILGLDGCRTTAEEHHDPVDGPSLRNRRAVDALLSAFGDAPALVGWHLPYEWRDTPSPEDTALVAAVSSHVRAISPDLPLSVWITRDRMGMDGRNHRSDPEDRLTQYDESQHRGWWIDGMWEFLAEANPDIAIFRSEMSSLRWTAEQVSEDTELLADLTAEEGVRLWGQAGGYRVAPVGEAADPAYHPPASQELLTEQLAALGDAEERVLFSYHDLMTGTPGFESERSALAEALAESNSAPSTNEAGPSLPSSMAQPGDPDPNSMLGKANTLDQELHERKMLFGQVLTVMRPRSTPEDTINQWQEDSDWLTGLYTATEAFHYKVTDDPQARANAKESFDALHLLSTVSGVPGVVARCARKNFAGELPTEGRKVYRKTGDWYWVADISRDQLTGHLFGYAVYYDLVADEAEKEVCRQDIEDIVGKLLEDDMWARDFDGERTIHANCWASPLMALWVLKVASRITGDEKYEAAYQNLIDPHFLLGHALKQAQATEDAFFQHYHHDSVFYHIMLYESDPRIRGLLAWALQMLYRDTRDNGNVQMDFNYALFNPETDAEMRGMAELMAAPLHVQSGEGWQAAIAERITQGDWPYPEDVVREVIFCHDPEATESSERPVYIPIEIRAPREYEWNYHVGSEFSRRTPGVGAQHGGYPEYSGIGYLLTYWLGRYHGWIPATL